MFTNELLYVTIMNVNDGHNNELTEHCRTLKEYAQYVARVRKYAADPDIMLEEAVERAVEECIKEGILAEFLMRMYRLFGRIWKSIRISKTIGRIKIKNEQKGVLQRMKSSSQHSLNFLFMCIALRTSIPRRYLGS